MLRKTWNTLGATLKNFVTFAETKADKLIFVLIGVYTLIFSGFTIYMHYAFKTYAWDLGVFTQALWSTVNLGKPFYYTIESIRNPSLNFLGAHFSPVLLLVVPVYAIYQSPITLLVLQSFVIGVAALPIYWIAKDKLYSKLWGLTFAVAFLLHPALHGMNCFDFHVEAFIPVFFLMAFYYFDKGDWFRGFIFSILVLSTIEFAPILTAFLGAYFIIKAINKQRKIEKRIIFPTSLIIISVLWLFFAFSLLHSINPLKAVGLPGNWDKWGTSMTEVIYNIVKNPIKTLGTIVNPIEKAYYVFLIFAPVVFLSILAPLELSLAFPWIFAALISEYSPYYEPYFQYFGFIAGQIFLSAIYGTKTLLKKSTTCQNHLGIEKKLMAIILIISLASSIAVSPIGLPALTRRKVEMTDHTKTLHEALALIPSTASVATQNDILPHLAQREKIFILGWPMETEVDFILLDLKSSHVFYGPTPTATSPIEALCIVLQTGKYGVKVCADGILLLEKGYSGIYEIFKPYNKRFTYEDLYTLPSTSYVRFDGTSESGNVLVHNADHKPGIIWYGPYVWLYAGNYNVTFKMKTASENVNVTLDVFFSEFNSVTNTWSSGTLNFETLNFSDFGSLGQWKEFALNFQIDTLKRLEFRGMCETENMSVALDYIEVTQLGP
ncbi:DUF2079 domain-containing protein [Candidatus Bathyarchaeota archaeon]|nr:DUF2079 domain-containing protein [Candidatus Bathyarchaeota archaeon]